MDGALLFVAVGLGLGMFAGVVTYGGVHDVPATEILFGWDGLGIAIAAGGTALVMELTGSRLLGSLLGPVVGGAIAGSMLGSLSWAGVSGPEAAVFGGGATVLLVVGVFWTMLGM